MRPCRNRGLRPKSTIYRRAGRGNIHHARASLRSPIFADLKLEGKSRIGVPLVPPGTDAPCPDRSPRADRTTQPPCNRSAAPQKIAFRQRHVLTETSAFETSSRRLDHAYARGDPRPPVAPSFVKMSNVLPVRGTGRCIHAHLNACMAFGNADAICQATASSFAPIGDRHRREDVIPSTTGNNMTSFGVQRAPIQRRNIADAGIRLLSARSAARITPVLNSAPRSSATGRTQMRRRDSRLSQQLMSRHPGRRSPATRASSSRTCCDRCRPTSGNVVELILDRSWTRQGCADTRSAPRTGPKLRAGSSTALRRCVTEYTRTLFGTSLGAGKLLLRTILTAWASPSRRPQIPGRSFRGRSAGELTGADRDRRRPELKNPRPQASTRDLRRAGCRRSTRGAIPQKISLRRAAWARLIWTTPSARAISRPTQDPWRAWRRRRRIGGIRYVDPRLAIASSITITRREAAQKARQQR